MACILSENKTGRRRNFIFGIYTNINTHFCIKWILFSVWTMNNLFNFNNRIFF